MRTILPFVAVSAVFSAVVIGCSSPEPAADKDPQPASSGTTDGASAPAAAGESKMAAMNFEQNVKGVLTEYCVQCHSGDAPKGGVDISKMNSADDVKNSGAKDKMVEEVEGKKMPPEKGKAMPDDVRAKLVADLKAL